MAATVVQRHPLPVIRNKVGVFSVVVIASIFYMIAFPKGGIKFGGIPLTIGYVLTALLAVLTLFRGNGFALAIDRLLVFLSCLILAGWSYIVIHINGSEYVSATISYFVAVLYLPAFGMIVFSSNLLDDHYENVEKTFLWAVRFIVAYGIFLFVFKQLTGRWIEIPYVTVNAADVGQLDDKFIRRGIFFKLISTYNNGNIFGLCVAMMAPLYFQIERSKIMRSMLYLALFLTLSRTSWIGMALIFAMQSISKGVKPSTIMYILIAGLVSFIAFSFAATAMGRDTSFLWDRNLGGRIDQLQILSDMRIIPDEPFTFLPEIAYLGVIKFFGIPGLILFVFYLAISPMLLWLEGVRLFNVGPTSACMQGLLIYMIMACADAAFLLIPVMMVFWMIAGMGFWYAHRQAWLEGRAHAAVN